MKTGIPMVDGFLEEIDRRIADPAYDEAHRDWLIKNRPAVVLLATMEPEKFAETMRKILPKYGVNPERVK